MAAAGAAVGDRGLRARAGAAARAGRRAARRPGAARGDGRGVALAAPARTRPSGSPRRSWPRSGKLPGRERELRRATWRDRELHFIAIGGAGMSGLALVCAQLGARVTGSDRAESSYLRRLREPGSSRGSATTPSRCPPGAEVVVSTAIAEDNPELARARERGQRVIHRGELLAELCALRRLIAVAGTHGKTTTAGMLVHALRELGADPCFLLGGELPGAGPGGRARQRRLGRGRVDRRRGRRVRRQLPRAAPRDRGGHQRRARPPLALGLARGAARGLRRASPRRRPRLALADRRRARRRSAAAQRAVRFDAERPGPPPRPARSPAPQPPQRPRRARRRSSSPGFDARPSGARARRLPRDAAPPASARAAARAPRSTTTTPTTRPRSRRRSRRCASSSRGA